MRGSQGSRGRGGATVASVALGVQLVLQALGPPPRGGAGGLVTEFQEHRGVARWIARQAPGDGHVPHTEHPPGLNSVVPKANSGHSALGVPVPVGSVQPKESEKPGRGRQLTCCLTPGAKVAESLGSRPFSPPLVEHKAEVSLPTSPSFPPFRPTRGPSSVPPSWRLPQLPLP